MKAAQRRGDLCLVHLLQAFISAILHWNPEGRPLSHTASLPTPQDNPPPYCCCGGHEPCCSGSGYIPCPGMQENRQEQLSPPEPDPLPSSYTRAPVEDPRDTQPHPWGLSPKWSHTGSQLCSKGCLVSPQALSWPSETAYLSLEVVGPLH